MATQMKLFRLSQQERDAMFEKLVGLHQDLTQEIADAKIDKDIHKERIDQLKEDIANLVEDLGDGRETLTTAAATDSSGVVTKLRKAQ